MVAPPRTEGDRWIDPMGATNADCGGKSKVTCKPLLARRQRDAKTPAATRPILHRYDPTEAQNQVPRDGKTEPGTAAIAVARGLKTQERLENPLAIRRRHARAA